MAGSRCCFSRCWANSDLKPERIWPDDLEGVFNDMSGNLMPAFDISVYYEVCMDFNGSMAFFHDD